MRYLLLFLLCFEVIFSIHLKGATNKYYTDSSVYDVTCYKINLSNSCTNTFIEGYTEVIAKAVNPLKMFAIEFNPSLTIDSVLINNLKYSYLWDKSLLKIRLNTLINSLSLIYVKIYYHGIVNSASPFGGLRIKQETDYATNIIYTLSEPFYAREWFPCKQVLNDKADSVIINITVPSDYKVGSNGLLQKTVNLPDNKKRYEWASYYPTAYYLISFTAARYKDYSYYIKYPGKSDSLLFQNYIYNDPEYLIENKIYIDETAQILQLYEELFMPYPFRNEKYGHCVAPVGGGMENQTMTSVDNFSFDLVAHELAHSWFGNMVTCNDWQNIWINEGFASYLEYLAYEFLRPAEAQSWLEKAVKNAKSEPNGSVFISMEDSNDDNRIFSYANTYNKGALIIHQLRMKINNDTVFFKILNEFLKKYSYSNASAEDFKTIAENISQIKLTGFFNQWFYGKGFPAIKTEWNTTSDSISLSFEQSGSSSVTPIFDITFYMKVKFTNGTDTTIRINMDSKNYNIKFKINKMVSGITINHDYSALMSSIKSENRYGSQKLSFTPNPCKNYGILDFKYITPNHSIKLYDTYGRVINEWKTIKNPMKINTENLTKGMYLLCINSPIDSNTIKIIKE